MYSKKLFGVNSVLECRINGIAAWMTLNSSEIKTFLSWRVSTILKSSLVASASLHLALPPKIILFSRNQAHHLLLEVIDHDEEENSIFFVIGKARLHRVPGSISVHLLSHISTVLAEEQAEVGLRGVALAFGRLAKASTFIFNANSSDFVSEVSCSLSSYSLSIKSVTNLFNPWEILPHKWESSLFTDSILMSTPYLPCK